MDKKISSYLNIAPAFRHFTGSTKPWKTNSLEFSKYQKFYHDSLDGTTWSKFLQPKDKSFFKSYSALHLVRKLSFLKAAKLRRYLALQ
jgi:lipopolysaccharide biosynthesis glycosyltransferase